MWLDWAPILCKILYYTLRCENSYQLVYQLVGSMQMITSRYHPCHQGGTRSSQGEASTPIWRGEKTLQTKWHLRLSLIEWLDINSEVESKVRKSRQKDLSKAAEVRSPEIRRRNRSGCAWLGCGRGERAHAEGPRRNGPCPLEDWLKETIAGTALWVALH